MIRPITNYRSAVAQAETRHPQVVGIRQHSCVRFGLEHTSLQVRELTHIISKDLSPDSSQIILEFDRLEQLIPSHNIEVCNTTPCPLKIPLMADTPRIP